jgi:hypothetical protein
MRTIVTFRSRAFNTSETRADYINPANYGDDLARWLIDRLALRGVTTDPAPGQEDFGWYFGFDVAGTPHCLVVGYRPGDGHEEGEWVAWLERRAGFVASLFGGRSRGIAPAAAAAVHAALSSAPEIEDVRWHEAAHFRAGLEEDDS